MKMSDISQKLTERPGGFGGAIKAKLQSQIPFARKQQRKGKAKTALYKQARAIKKELQNWKAEAFAATSGEDTELTMNQFLGWVKNRQPKYAQGIETIARGDKDYADFFSQRIDKKGKQSSTASDPKVKVQPSDGEQSKEEIKAVYKKKGEELEAKRKAQGGELVDEDEGSDDTKADTSASIYEARLRAILEADVGVNRTKTLKDNQVDTLITLGIQKQKELDSGDDDIAAAGPEAQAPAGKPTATASDDFLDEYQDELVSVLTKVKNGDELDKRDKSNAGKMLYSLD